MRDRYTEGTPDLPSGPWQVSERGKEGAMGRMEGWKGGRMERWKDGRMEGLGGGNLALTMRGGGR